MRKLHPSNLPKASNKERGSIELHLRGLSDLVEVNASPLKNGALTADAESYIVSKAKQFPAHQPIHLVIKSTEPLRLDVGPSIRAHFCEAAQAEAANMSELFRGGRKALLIGLLTLGLCLFLAWYFTYHAAQRPITRLIQESFVILGWVSMWKPIEIFLYEWLPLARRRKLFLRLSLADINSMSPETR
jgi:hypothetical protein